MSRGVTSCDYFDVSYKYVLFLYPQSKWWDILPPDIWWSFKITGIYSSFPMLPSFNSVGLACSRSLKHKALNFTLVSSSHFFRPARDGRTIMSCVIVCMYFSFTSVSFRHPMMAIRYSVVSGHFNWNVWTTMPTTTTTTRNEDSTTIEDTCIYSLDYWPVCGNIWYLASHLDTFCLAFRKSAVHVLQKFN